MPQENEALWQACLEIIQTKIKKESFYTWFRPTKGVPDQEKILKVAVPNGFVAEWLEEHYLNLIQQVAQEKLGSDLEIKFCLFKDIGEKEEVTIQAQAPENSDKISNPYRMAVAKRCPSHLGNGVNDSFNPRYTFEAFVVGENSQFAR